MSVASLPRWCAWLLHASSYDWNVDCRELIARMTANMLSVSHSSCICLKYFYPPPRSINNDRFLAVLLNHVTQPGLVSGNPTRHKMADAQNDTTVARCSTLHTCCLCVCFARLDSMRWFSHRRRTGGRKAPEDREPLRKPLSACTAVTLSPPAATQWHRLLLRAAYGVGRTPFYALSIGWLSSFSFFVPGDLDLWPLTLTFEVGRDFCTLHLTAKFHHLTFNRSEVILLTNRQNWKINKQTDAAENIHLAPLCYAVG